MSKDPAQDPKSGSISDEIIFVEHGTEHPFQHEGGDYDGEFRHSGQLGTSLYSLDSQSRVLYIGTLNKSMFVSLRLAYALVPKQLVEPLANIRTQLDGFTAVTEQQTMTLFMHEVHFSSYIRRMRAIYAEKRVELLKGLAPLATQGWTWSRNAAGMHLLICHQHGDYVRNVAKNDLLALALLSTYRVARRHDDGLFLRYAALDKETMQTGVASLLETAGKVALP
jgi:GntR family transcriptional regulator / MocR family aminotransferase